MATTTTTTSLATTTVRPQKATSINNNRSNNKVNEVNEVYLSNWNEFELLDFSVVVGWHEVDR